MASPFYFILSTFFFGMRAAITTVYEGLVEEKPNQTVKSLANITGNVNNVLITLEGSTSRVVIRYFARRGIERRREWVGEHLIAVLEEVGWRLGEMYNIHTLYIKI